MSLPAHMPHPCLLADVGGTNARFACAREPDGPLSDMIVLPTGGHGDFTSTVREAITAAGFPAPRSMLVAAAGPISGREMTFTNARTPDGRLTLHGQRLAAGLGLAQGLLLNDFEALSLSLPFLTPGDLMPLGGGAAVPGGPLLVIGAGTGLGVGALLSVDGRLLPVASEAGHVGLGPETAAEQALWSRLGQDRLAAEDLLSGRGLHRLYRAIAAGHDRTAGLADAAAVTAAAHAGRDADAAEAAETFCRLIGRVAGDMAMAFCATGGVYIGGGIAPRFRETIGSGGFRAAFESKGSQTGYVRAIPTALIVAGAPALTGLAAIAAAPQRFALDYGRRFWCGA